MDLRAQLILAEMKAREIQRQQVAEIVKSVRGELFKQQLDLWDDPAREKAALCTRRAGKTSAWVRIATCTALLHPRTITRIWAISRLRCKDLIWNELLLLIARHRIELDGKPNETELRVTFKNGSEIRLVGADKDKEAQKKRGDKTILEIVIEAQMYGPFLKSLVEDVIGPCLFDLNGTMYLEGTPGMICGGYWFDVTGQEDVQNRWLSKGTVKDGSRVGAGWSCHRWSLLDNPHLPDARAKLTEIIKKRNWTHDDPTYVREYLGKWVNDFNALYYNFDPVRNVYGYDIQPWGPGWTHTLGWDLGSKDDMALVAWGYHPKLPKLYEAFSWKKPGASMDEVMDQIGGLESRGFNITQMFADTGGGGRMYVEEVMKRYPRSFQPAKKTEKYEHVLLMNGDLRGGFVQLAPGSVYAQEMAALPKKQPWPDPDDPQAPPSEDPRFPNHCCDAGLYSYRGAMHYLHRPEPELPKPNTDVWYKAQEAAIIRQLQAQKQESDQNWLDRLEQSESQDYFDE